MITSKHLLINHISSLNILLEVDVPLNKSINKTKPNITSYDYIKYLLINEISVLNNP